MLRGVRRLLREHGFEAIAFDTAEALQDHGRFDEACCIILDINLNDESGIDLRHRLAASGVSVADHLYHRQRQSCDARGGDGIGMSCLSVQAVYCKVADRAD